MIGRIRASLSNGWRHARGWGRSAWQRTRAWFLGVLVALGVVAAPALSQTDQVQVGWSNPTTYTDGSALDPASDLQEIRVICDTVSDPFVFASPVETGELDLPFGESVCYAIAVDIYGSESLPSNMVTITLDRGQPSPPVFFGPS